MDLGATMKTATPTIASIAALCASLQPWQEARITPEGWRVNMKIKLYRPAEAEIVRHLAPYVELIDCGNMTIAATRTGDNLILEVL
jgi:hypothetical protein